MSNIVEKVGSVYDGLLDTIDKQLDELKRQNKEIDRFQSERLKNSNEFEMMRMENAKNRAKLTTSNIHLFNLLDEMEARFDRTKEFDSPEICIHYLDAAKYCAKYFDRTNNRVNDAQHWYDNYSLRF